MKKLLLILPIIALGACDKPVQELDLSCLGWDVHTKIYENRAQLDFIRNKPNPENTIPFNYNTKYLEKIASSKLVALEKFSVTTGKPETKTENTGDPKFYGEYKYYYGKIPETNDSIEFRIQSYNNGHTDYMFIFNPEGQPIIFHGCSEK